MGDRLEVFKVFSENYVKPVLSNPKVTTALVLVILVRLGFDVAAFIGKDSVKTVDSVEELPVISAPVPSPEIKVEVPAAPAQIPAKDWLPVIRNEVNSHDEKLLPVIRDEADKAAKRESKKVYDELYDYHR